MRARTAIGPPLDQEEFPVQAHSPKVQGIDSGEERGSSRPPVPSFGLLGPSAEERKRRRMVMGFTPFLEALAVIIMFWALMSLPPPPSLNTARHEVLYFQPISPADLIKRPHTLLKQPVLPRQAVLSKPQREQTQRPTEVARQKVPEISQPKIELPRTPPAPDPVEHFSSPEVPHPAPRQVAMLRMGAFNPGSMARATVKRPISEVQMGGFGADNGIPNNPSADSQNHLAQLGSFELPPGPGHGNGTGGARGVPGTVASVGFGNGVGAATGRRSNLIGGVQESDFGAVVAGKTVRAQSVAEVAAFKPVVILSKPDPVYPPEARQLHIEGQVILRVLFGSTGSLRVLRVERGLRYGMDEAAIEAAERIRFKPAERDGSPVDSTALVHIIFQLAY